jgi:hypothetical protein
MRPARHCRLRSFDLFGLLDQRAAGNPSVKFAVMTT